MAEPTPDPISSKASTPISPRPKLTLGDSVSVGALLLGVYLVIVVPPLLFKIILLVGVCAGIFAFSHYSHWTHEWSGSKQHATAFGLVVLFCLVAIPQFTSQWREEHYKTIREQPKATPPTSQQSPVAPLPEDQKKPKRAVVPKKSVERAPVSPPQTQINNAPNGIAIGGGTVSNPTVNNFAAPARHLDPAQLEFLDREVPSLPVEAATRLLFQAINETETITYADEIEKVFKTHGRMQDANIALGWHGGPIPRGVTVLAKDESDAGFPLAQQVANLLLKAGIPNLQFTKGEVKPGQVMVVIGPRPDN